MPQTLKLVQVQDPHAAYNSNASQPFMSLKVQRLPHSSQFISFSGLQFSPVTITICIKLCMIADNMARFTGSAHVLVYQEGLRGVLRLRTKWAKLIW